MIPSRYLEYSITKVRRQDSQSVIVYVSRNIHGRYLAWNFVRNNWNTLVEWWVFVTFDLQLITTIFSYAGLVQVVFSIV